MAFAFLNTSEAKECMEKEHEDPRAYLALVISSTVYDTDHLPSGSFLYLTLSRKGDRGTV